jgi:predicted ester cyclase
MGAVMNNKELVEHYADTVWNKKDLSIIDKVLHERVVIHSLLGNYHGIQSMKDIVKAWIAGFPDIKVETIASIAEKDKVVLHWKASGTFKGSLRGVLPTGKTAYWEGVTIYALDKGKVLEYWAYLDMEYLFNQIR